MSSGGIDRYERMLALHHALRLNRRITAEQGADPVERVEYPMSLHEQDQRLLAESVRLVAGVAPELARRFYARLFAARPFLRGLFPAQPEAMIAQHDKLVKALLSLVAGYARPELLAPALAQLGRDHRKFGVRPAHYDAVGEALVGALRELAGPAWRAEYEQAWSRAYAHAAHAMIAAAEAAETEPPFWYATVVSHELRHPEIAVLRLRPGQPYPYRSGQFATVESPHVPRVWRPYSLATSPRPDSVLELHVRVVPDGMVSTALGHKTAVGDVLRLGPPIGTSVLDPESRRDLLLVAGGTGLAPLKALADQIAELSPRAHRPRVWLFVGARRPGELYDLADLRRMSTAHPWLSIMYAVSDGWPGGAGEPGFPAETGPVSDVFARYGYWRDHDVYLAGPPGMVRASLHRLAELGVPAGRIRWDAYGELADVAAP